jgi:hypothetical protein
MSQSPAQQHTAVLMQALHFTADELLLNRAGQLSPAQAERVGARLRAGTGAMWKIILFVLVITAAGFGLLFLTGNFRLDTPDAPVIVLALVGTLVLWGVLMALGYWRSRRTANQTNWPVRSVTGRASSSVFETSGYGANRVAAEAALAVGGEGVDRGVLIIGQVYLSLPENIIAAFENDRPYTVYYVGSKRGGVPVSAEALEDAAR